MFISDAECLGARPVSDISEAQLLRHPPSEPTVLQGSQQASPGSRTRHTQIIKSWNAHSVMDQVSEAIAKYRGGGDGGRNQSAPLGKAVWSRQEQTEPAAAVKRSGGAGGCRMDMKNCLWTQRVNFVFVWATKVSQAAVTALCLCPSVRFPLNHKNVLKFRDR